MWSIKSMEKNQDVLGKKFESKVRFNEKGGANSVF